MSPKHQTGLLFVNYRPYNKFEFAGIFISKLKIYTVFRDILSICQLHILLSRTAQISLEMHFCVELHTKKPPSPRGTSPNRRSVIQPGIHHQCIV